MTTLTENDVTFKKEVVSVEVADVGDLTDVVRQVYWRYVAEWTHSSGEVIRAKTYITTDLPDPNPETYIAYDSLDSDTVMSFITISPEDEAVCKETALNWLNDMLVGADEPEDIEPEVRETRSWI